MNAASWVRFVNEEAKALEALGTLPRGVPRAHLRDRLRERFAFPLQLQARALVVGERPAAPARATASGAQATLAAAGARVLEVVPEGLTREAAALTGPWLVPCERNLQPGSVLRLDATIPDAGAAGEDDAQAPGVPLEVRSLEVAVAVEP